MELKTFVFLSLFIPMALGAYEVKGAFLWDLRWIRRDGSSQVLPMNRRGIGTLLATEILLGSGLRV